MSEGQRSVFGEGEVERGRHQRRRREGRPKLETPGQRVCEGWSGLEGCRGSWITGGGGGVGWLLTFWTVKSGEGLCKAGARKDLPEQPGGVPERPGPPVPGSAPPPPPPIPAGRGRTAGAAGQLTRRAAPEPGGAASCPAGVPVRAGGRGRSKRRWRRRRGKAADAGRRGECARPESPAGSGLQRGEPSPTRLYLSLISISLPRDPPTSGSRGPAHACRVAAEGVALQMPAWGLETPAWGRPVPHSAAAASKSFSVPAPAKLAVAGRTRTHTLAQYRHQGPSSSAGHRRRSDWARSLQKLVGPWGGAGTSALSSLLLPGDPRPGRPTIDPSSGSTSPAAKWWGWGC